MMNYLLDDYTHKVEITETNVYEVEVIAACEDSAIDEADCLIDQVADKSIFKKTTDREFDITEYGRDD